MAGEVDIIGDGYRESAGEKTALETRMIDLLKLRPDMHILDVGCGDGRVTKMIADHEAKPNVIGVDIDSSLIAEARGRGLTVMEVNAADIGEKHFPHKFNVVFSNLALQWLKSDWDFSHAIGGMNTVLTGRGRIVLSFPSQLHPEIEKAFVNAMQEVTGATRLEALVQIPIRYTSIEYLEHVLEEAHFSTDGISVIQNNRHRLPQGMEAWLIDFLGPHMQIASEQKERVVAHMVEALKKAPSLYDAKKQEWYIASDMFVVEAKRERELEHASPILNGRRSPRETMEKILRHRVVGCEDFKQALFAQETSDDSIATHGVHNFMTLAGNLRMTLSKLVHSDRMPVIRDGDMEAMEHAELVVDGLFHALNKKYGEATEERARLAQQQQELHALFQELRDEMRHALANPLSWCVQRSDSIHERF